MKEEKKSVSHSFAFSLGSGSLKENRDLIIAQDLFPQTRTNSGLSEDAGKKWITQTAFFSFFPRGSLRKVSGNRKLVYGSRYFCVPPTERRDAESRERNDKRKEMTTVNIVALCSKISVHRKSVYCLRGLMYENENTPRMQWWRPTKKVNKKKKLKSKKK